MEIIDHSLQEKDRYNIMCLTETGERFERLRLSNDYQVFNSMRKGKGGGGIKIVLKKHGKVDLKETSSKCAGILDVRGKIGHNDAQIIVIYMAPQRSGTGAEKNKEIEEEINEKIKDAEDRLLLIVGDCNSHLNMVDHLRQTDKNGERIIRLMEANNLICLNADGKCNGTYTWGARGIKSAIDLALVNTNMYEKIEKMDIDENQEKLAISDHNLLEIHTNLVLERKKIRRKTKKEKFTYSSRKKEDIQKYVAALVEMWTIMIDHIGEEELDMEIVEDCMKKCREKFLKKVGKKWILEGDKTTTLLTKEIRDVIAKKRYFNKLEKKSIGAQKEEYKMKRIEYTRKMTMLINQEKLKAEIELDKAIKNSSNKSKARWTFLNKMRNKGNNTKEETEVYENGKKIDKNALDTKFFKKWETEIYGIHNIEQEPDPEWWSEKLEEDVEGEEAPRGLTDHIELYSQKHKSVPQMQLQKMETWDLETIIKNLKDGKAPGEDGIVGEVWKEIAGNEVCMKVLVLCYNKILETRKSPESWRRSITKLIKKCKSPSVFDFRPIALLNISYKILMTFIRTGIQDHMKENGLGRDNQTGFTKGGRIELNLLVVIYAVESYFHDQKNRKKRLHADRWEMPKRSFEVRREAKDQKFQAKIIDKERGSQALYIVAIDFKKAYDRVERSKLFQILKKYKIDPKVTELLMDIYSGDHTLIEMMGEERRLEINAGIRQGCTLSTELFKLVTIEIIKNLERHGDTFRIRDLDLSSLFFADDNLMMGASITQVRHNLKVIEETSKIFGLEINRRKSKIMKLGGDSLEEEVEQAEEIEDIPIVKNLKYLGVTICNDYKDIFRDQKIWLMERLKAEANRTYYAIENSFNRVITGKLWWKTLALPVATVGVGVINLSKTQINELQLLENRVWRMVFKAKKFTPIVTLRGEAGALQMKHRMAESKLLLAWSIMQGENELMKEILTRMWEDKTSQWGQSLKEDAQKYDINLKMIEEQPRNWLRGRIREIDTDEWKEELKLRSTLSIYRKHKSKFGDEGIYDNRRSSELLFRARTNTLELFGRINYNTEESKLCPYCDVEENIVHFLLHCDPLEPSRDKSLIKKYSSIGQSDEVTAGRLLFDFGGGGPEPVKKMILALWRSRSKLLRGENGVSSRLQQ